jgi:large subunit ribosomal protein L13
MGKHKPIYDPSGMFYPLSAENASLIYALVDCGDYVIVTNSRSVKVTGRKDEQLLYRKHSMFPGGLKETPYKDMKSRKPDEVSSSAPPNNVIMVLMALQIIRHAVAGMLPKNKLRDRRLERLKIFPSYHMGVLGGNILRSWDDGTLPVHWDPTKPTTTMTLKKNWRTTKSL